MSRFFPQLVPVASANTGTLSPFAVPRFTTSAAICGSCFRSSGYTMQYRRPGRTGSRNMFAAKRQRGVLASPCSGRGGKRRWCYLDTVPGGLNSGNLGGGRGGCGLFCFLRQLGLDFLCVDLLPKCTRGVRRGRRGSEAGRTRGLGILAVMVCFISVLFRAWWTQNGFTRASGICKQRRQVSLWRLQ